MHFLLISQLKQREWADDCYRTAVYALSTQISAKQAIKRLKKWSVDAIIKEYKQLHDMNTFGISCPEDLTPKHKRGSLRAITLIKDKRSVKLKE